jgi:hypothetical protein
MPMKPFQLMSDAMRELVSRFIEQYHLTEDHGQFSFELKGQKFKLQNFAVMTGVVMRMIAYTTLRSNLQGTMDKFRESVDIESPELWREAIKEMRDTYEPFIDFVLSGKSQFDSFFKVIGEMLNEENIEDPRTSIVFTLLDVAGMCDHAVSYGVYLIKEFQRMLDDKDIESLMENQDKFPVTMKIAHSQSEADEWVKEQKNKDREESRVDPNDLSRMKPIGGMQ